MSEDERVAEEQDKGGNISERRSYVPPALKEDEVFERAVYAACKASDMPPDFCDPIGFSSG